MNSTRSRRGSSTLAVALAGIIMLLLGAVIAVPLQQQQIAYAHTFSGDESAGFLELAENIKIELGLVQSNVASNNVTLAQEHADHAQQYIDEHTISEIRERNERLANDLPAALEDLSNTVASSTEQQVQSKIQNIRDLLDETVSVRVEPGHMTNSTVQALVFANLLTSISFQGHGHYEIAIGISDHHAHGDGEDHDDHTEEEHDEHDQSGHNNGNDNMTMTVEEAPDEIVDWAHYQTARAVAVRAQELWTELKPMAPSTADSHAI